MSSFSTYSNLSRVQIYEDFTEWEVKYPDPELPRKIKYFLNKLTNMHEFANYTMCLHAYVFLKEVLKYCENKSLLIEDLGINGLYRGLG